MVDHASAPPPERARPPPPLPTPCSLCVSNSCYNPKGCGEDACMTGYSFYYINPPTNEITDKVKPRLGMTVAAAPQVPPQRRP